jgi:hypothetical protein
MSLTACPECRSQISDQAMACPHCGKVLREGRMFGYEYRSNLHFGSLPFLHIAYGLDPFTGRKRVAKGVIAIGDIAVGIVALGGCAFGGITLGGCAIGLISLGGLAIGLGLAIGGLAIGSLALGGGAVGLVALGGGAYGYYALGGGAGGTHVLSAAVRDPQALEFFRHWLGSWVDKLNVPQM